LDQVLDRFREIEARMGAAADGAEIVRLSKEHAELRPVAEAVEALARVRAEAPELEEMAASGDKEMADLAREELAALNERLPGLEREVALLLAPKDRDESASAILEVRAGTGGDEAALFAGDLFRMYQRYAQLHGWRVEIDSVSEGDVGGYKEIIASITGEGVFGRLKFESGVHRVQRVPETEAGGRIHTSAATVAVLPEPEDVDIVINDADIRIDTYRSSGAGGQHVNKTDSAVRITHLPTGIVVTSSEKSQHQNRARAMKVLQARLYEQKREALDSERAESRKSQVGSGDRSERIRTYNFPQGRVTDHRINLTLYNLPKVLAGEALDEIINPLIAEDQAARLAALEEELA
jgi:peptide chain release factor 1